MPAKQIVHTPRGDMLLGEAARRSGLRSRLIAQRINNLCWTGYDAVTVPPGGKRKYWLVSKHRRIDGERQDWEENARPGDIPPYEDCAELEYVRYKTACLLAREEQVPMGEWLKTKRNL
jgi:hypothetical protein